MTLLDVLLISLIRGLGEVLPLGASGILAALPWSNSAPEALAALSVAAHLGILIGLMLYFWRDMALMGRGIWRLVKGKPDGGSYLVLHLAVGTLPAALGGWFLLDLMSGHVGAVMASGLILVGGILLWGADKLGVTVRRIEHMGVISALILGAAQVLAVFPGVSRSGITITLARLMGWERQAAVRLSLLLALPLLAGLAGRTLWGLAGRAQLILSGDLVIAAVAAGLSSLLGVAVMMAWVERRSFAPFAIIRILLGAGLLTLSLLG